MSKVAVQKKPRQNFLFKRTKDGGACLTLKISEACFTMRMSPQEVALLQKKIENWHRRMHGKMVMSGDVRPKLHKVIIIVLKDRIAADFLKIPPATRAVMCRALKKITGAKAKADAKKRGDRVKRMDILNAQGFSIKFLEKHGIPASNPRHPFWKQPTKVIADKLAPVVKKAATGLSGMTNVGRFPTYFEGALTPSEVAQATSIMGQAAQGSPAAQLMIMEAVKAAEGGSKRAQRDVAAMHAAKTVLRKGVAQELRKRKAKEALAKGEAVKEAITKSVGQINAAMKNARKAQAIKKMKVQQAKNAIRSAKSAAGETPTTQVALAIQAKKAIKQAQIAKKVAAEAVAIVHAVKAKQMRFRSAARVPYPLKHRAYTTG